MQPHVRSSRNVLFILIPTLAFLLLAGLSGMTLSGVLNVPDEPYNPGTPTPLGRPEGEFSGDLNWTEKVKLPFVSRYLVDLPPGYDATSGTKYPLIVYFHSASGTSMAFASFRQIARSDALLKANDKYPAIILYPHVPSQTVTWQQMIGAVNDLVSQIIDEYPIDTDRVYALGFSDGGYGALSIGVRFPERFAAVAEISGYYNNLDDLCNLKDTPVYVYHGDQDEVISVDQAYLIQKSLAGCSDLLTVTILKGKNHMQAAETTLDSIELYNNLFSNTLAH
jgi:predicted peptidase